MLLTAGCGRIAFDPQPQPDPDDPRWEPIGESATGTGATGAFTTGVYGGPRLVLDPDGHPIVSWSDAMNGNDEVRMIRWSGTAWSGIGESALPAGISRDPELSYLGGAAVAPDGRICQAWVADEINTMRLRCWDGSAWAGLAGSDTAMSTPGNPWWPVVRFIAGQPVLGWEDYGGGNGGVYVQRYTGTSWVSLGPMALPGIAGAGQYVSMAGSALDDIWAMWSNPDDGEVYVARWNGASWSSVGGNLSQTAALSHFGNLELGDAPYALWHEGAMDPAMLYARAWNGSAWIELGGSATGMGIAGVPVTINHADLAVTLDGNPIVVYAAGNDIYVRTWDGTAWTLVGDQDAGGISRTGRAGTPAIEVAADGAIIVAWYEDLPTGGQVYLRRLAAQSASTP